MDSLTWIDHEHCSVFGSVVAVSHLPFNYATNAVGYTVAILQHAVVHAPIADAMQHRQAARIYQGILQIRQTIICSIGLCRIPVHLSHRSLQDVGIV